MIKCHSWEDIQIDLYFMRQCNRFIFLINSDEQDGKSFGEQRISVQRALDGLHNIFLASVFIEQELCFYLLCLKKNAVTSV